MSVPDELSLLSLFECEPKLLEPNIPYFYNEAAYEFDNSADERFIVRISPANSDITIQVFSANDNALKSALEFRNADGIEILSDCREESRLLIRTGLHTVVRINFKPRFKIFLTS